MHGPWWRSVNFDTKKSYLNIIIARPRVGGRLLAGRPAPIFAQGRREGGAQSASA